MIDPLIICGSLGRPNLPLLKWISDPEVIVEPQEEEIYRKQNPNLKFHVLPKSHGGFSYMMNHMVKVCLSQGRKYFVFTDDDVTGLKSRSSVDEKFKKITDSEVKKVISKAVAYCEKNNIDQLAISFSGQSWSAKKDYQEPVGAWGVYICNAYAVKSVGGFDEKLIIFSDWEMSARLIQAGYRVVRTNLITFEHKMKGMTGGAEAIYKQKEKVKVAAEAISQRYGPNSCKVVFIPEHDLHEVRFTWKKLRR